MIIIVGLVILVAALIAGVAGVLGNDGSGHAVAHFSVLGYHLTGSAGTLFLSGIVVGAAGLLGLTLLLAGARRTSRRGSAARRGLRQSRRETAAASQERDELIGQRDAARDAAAGHPGNGTTARDAPPSPASDRWARLRDLRRRLVPAPTAAPADSAASRPVPDVPASTTDPGATAITPASDVPDGAPGADISHALDVHASASAPAE
jgi:hypothetical protein